MFCDSTGFSRNTRPKTKYRIAIQGRVTGLPNTNQENRKLTSVAAIAARLKA